MELSVIWPRPIYWGMKSPHQKQISTECDRRTWHTLGKPYIFSMYDLFIFTWQLKTRVFQKKYNISKHIRTNIHSWILSNVLHDTTKMFMKYLCNINMNTFFNCIHFEVSFYIMRENNLLLQYRNTIAFYRKKGWYVQPHISMTRTCKTGIPLCQVVTDFLLYPWFQKLLMDTNQ